MQVIKVVQEKDFKLISIFARNEWRKGYAEGVETKPDVGYLFAYPRRNMMEAMRDVGAHQSFQFWLAEAEVVGRIISSDITVMSYVWDSFWKEFKPRLRVKGADYLLCSSITLIRKLG